MKNAIPSLTSEKNNENTWINLINNYNTQDSWKVVVEYLFRYSLSTVFKQLLSGVMVLQWQTFVQNENSAFYISKSVLLKLAKTVIFSVWDGKLVLVHHLQGFRRHQDISVMWCLWMQRHFVIL